MSELTSETFPDVVSRFLKAQGMDRRHFALLIGCSKAVVDRLLDRETLPTTEMLHHSAILIELGVGRFAKLSAAEKERISEALGACGGAVLGFGSVTAIIGALGTVSGLSAAGITSGLFALGQLVGAGMAAGVAVAAAIPLAAGGIGYGLVKVVKRLAREAKLNSVDFEERWERKPE